jgi:hypothetical protein
MNRVGPEFSEMLVFGPFLIADCQLLIANWSRVGDSLLPPVFSISN